MSSRIRPGEIIHQTAVVKTPARLQRPERGLEERKQALNIYLLLSQSFRCEGNKKAVMRVRQEWRRNCFSLKLG
jgi:hypothetical protein